MVQGSVADVAASYEVDDIFGDVGGVIAYALEIFGDPSSHGRKVV